jgi:hypothetical protein
LIFVVESDGSFFKSPTLPLVFLKEDCLNWSREIKLFGSIVIAVPFDIKINALPSTPVITVCPSVIERSFTTLSDGSASTVALSITCTSPETSMKINAPFSSSFNANRTLALIMKYRIRIRNNMSLN